LKIYFLMNNVGADYYGNKFTWAGKCVYKAGFCHQSRQLRQSIFLQNGWNSVTATLNVFKTS
jgi:hypothetical protein